MKRLNERVQDYFNQNLDEKFMQDKELFFKELDNINLKDIDFNQLYKTLNDNIKLVKERITLLEEYKIKSSDNIDIKEELLSRYKNIYQILAQRLLELEQYETQYNVIKSIHNELI